MLRDVGQDCWDPYQRQTPSLSLRANPPLPSGFSSLQCVTRSFPRIVSLSIFVAFFGFPLFSTTRQKVSFLAGVLIPAKVPSAGC